MSDQSPLTQTELISLRGHIHHSHVASFWFVIRVAFPTAATVAFIDGNQIRATEERESERLPKYITFVSHELKILYKIWLEISI